jgi:hypothetical protein
VLTANERSGLDTTAYLGDTLIVPVDPGIAAVLARYPLPNYVQGAYGIHTYAASSKATTNADQFSIRMDHQQGANHFFGRVSFDNLTGPTTNPDQSVLDPSFGIAYIDPAAQAGIRFSPCSNQAADARYDLQHHANHLVVCNNSRTAEDSRQIQFSLKLLY